MAVIQKTNQKSEEGGVDPSQTQVDITSSPVDSAVIQVSEVEDSKHIDPSQTSIPEDQITEGCAIKQYAIWKQVRKLHRKVYAQIGMALFRNIVCWAGLICLIYLLSRASIAFEQWGTPRLVLVVVIICSGFLTVGFHAHRAYLDLTFQKPTLIMDLLRDAVSREEFKRKVQNRELSAPEIFVEVSLRGGSMSYEDPTHWTRSPGRKTTKEITYRGWADQSKGVHTIPWPENGAAWIVVGRTSAVLTKIPGHLWRKMRPILEKTLILIVTRIS